ncbi:MAG TPA: hypothetical protein VKI19_09645 [Acidimicrobiales bacterium]|nr:hypothetical protein [Acidimicrobiales bacterium]
MTRAPAATAPLRAQPPAAAGRAAQRRLEAASALFTLAVIIHNSDHLRRGTDKLTPAVFWVGMAGILVEVGIVLAIYSRHRLAPAAAAIGGLGLAAGYVQVHVLPRNSFLSDSFTSSTHVSALSWFAASFEIAAALELAAAGFAAVAARGGWSNRGRSAPARPRRLLHPVPLVMAASQSAGLALALVQAYA